MNNNSIKFAVKLASTLINSALIIFSSIAFAEQLTDQTGEITPDEETIGGIGGTGIRSMSRPEILDRPERIERPELLESREVFDDSFEIDSPTDTGANEVEKPETVEE